MAGRRKHKKEEHHGLRKHVEHHKKVRKASRRTRKGGHKRDKK